MPTGILVTTPKIPLVYFLVPARSLRDQLVRAELLVVGRIRDLPTVDLVDDDLERVADRLITLVLFVVSSDRTAVQG